MNVSELLTDKSLRPVDLARVLGCHKSYVSHVTAGRKKLTKPAALKIFSAYGVKMGPIADYSDADCRTLARIEART